MTELEMAMGMIIDVFARYSGAQGDKLSLTKGELRTLLEKELSGFLESGKDKSTVDKLLKELDADRDAKMDFNQFMMLAALLTSTCHAYFEQEES